MSIMCGPSNKTGLSCRRWPVYGLQKGIETEIKVELLFDNAK
jgi:hypothetical protein